MKRATAYFDKAFNAAVISIHALVKRATVIPLPHVGNHVDFNPRPREEGDISEICSPYLHGDFNPRPREEGDRGTFT